MSDNGQLQLPEGKYRWFVRLRDGEEIGVRADFVDETEHGSLVFSIDTNLEFRDVVLLRDRATGANSLPVTQPMKVEVLRIARGQWRSVMSDDRPGQVPSFIIEAAGITPRQGVKSSEPK